MPHAFELHEEHLTILADQPMAYDGPILQELKTHSKSTMGYPHIADWDGSELEIRTAANQRVRMTFTQQGASTADWEVSVQAQGAWDWQKWRDLDKLVDLIIFLVAEQSLSELRLKYE